MRSSSHTPIMTTAMLIPKEWFHPNVPDFLNFSLSDPNNNLSHLIKNIEGQRQQQSSSSSSSSSSLLIVLTICYIMIFIAGILGNLITCFVISKNKFMHTATNFYLFNLAISDLILLLSGMPQDLYNLWHPYSYPFTDVPCIIEGVVCETAANATVLTVTAFTVERYIAICHPFRQHTMSKLSRAIKFIFGIWLTAFILALPQAMQFSVVSYDNGGIDCTINDDFFAHVFAVSGFIFFGGPMTAICVLYLLIGIKLKRSRFSKTMPRRCYHMQRGMNNSQARVIRMLIAVAVTFFFCWAPFHAQRLMAVYGSLAEIDSELFNRIFHILDYASGVLYFLSTCINPLLYNIMSHKFRDAFKVTLAHYFISQKTNGGRNNNSYRALNRRNSLLRRQHTMDSIRTNTTTTTINSSSSGMQITSQQHNVSRHNSYAGSQFARPSREEIHITKVSGRLHYRTRPSQLSQLSSIGDANSLLELENIENENHTNHHQSEDCNSNEIKHYFHILSKRNSNEASNITDPVTIDVRRNQNNLRGSNGSKYYPTSSNTESILKGRTTKKYKFIKSFKFNGLNEKFRWQRRRKKKQQLPEQNS